MPQMAPLNWLSLFIYFIIIFYLFNVMTYFLVSQKPLDKKLSFKMKSTNWKW